jgi:hypothetical protein
MPGMVMWCIMIKTNSKSKFKVEVLGVRVSAGAGNFSLHHRVQTGSGIHPPSYPMGTRGSFPGVKRPWRESLHSPPCSADVTKAWCYTSTPNTPLWRGDDLKHRENFLLLLYIIFLVID